MGGLAWSHIKSFQSDTGLPIALKGVQRGEDVIKAVEAGLISVVLSNHGGRQLHFSRPPLEVLVESRAIGKKEG